MTTQTDRVISELRDLLLAGEIQAGERLTELGFSARLGVSRTPLRLAFAELEKEGLLERLATGGYRVSTFTIEHIADAVDVRGVLEGMAARLIAERGMSSELRGVLGTMVAQGRDLVDTAARGEGRLVDAGTWRLVNQRFHEALTGACANEALIAAIERNNRLPFVGPKALALPLIPTHLETGFVARAQSDHEDIFEALDHREAMRVEALLREHAHRSRENKRKLIQEIRQMRNNQGESRGLGPAEFASELSLS